MALLHWIEDWTLINELLVAWLVLQPPLAVFWLPRERQLRRPDADQAAHPSRAGVMSASPSTAAREQTFWDRRFGPDSDLGVRGAEVRSAQVKGHWSGTKRPMAAIRSLCARGR
jgi:hypothetical protein